MTALLLFSISATVLRNRDLVPDRKKGGSSRFLPLLGAGVGTAFVLSLMVRAFFLIPVRPQTTDMEPTLKRGRWYYVRLGATMGTIAAGDLVWIRHPQAPELRLLRRVVAVGGDQMRQGEKLTVNGSPLAVPGVHLPDVDRGVLQLEKAQVFVVADAAAGGALDSRTFGPVALQDVLGKVWF